MENSLMVLHLLGKKQETCFCALDAKLAGFVCS
jgi:hypothetical protein